MDTYQITIYKDGDYYIAKCKILGADKVEKFLTQGKTEAEAFYMAADAFVTAKDLKVSWWDRFWHKLLRLS